MYVYIYVCMYVYSKLEIQNCLKKRKKKKRNPKGNNKKKCEEGKGKESVRHFQYQYLCMFEG